MSLTRIVPFLLLFAFCSCGDDGDSDAEVEIVNVLFANASPDAGDINVAIAGQQVVQALEFKSNTDYLGVEVTDNLVTLTISAGGITLEREVELLGDHNTVIICDELQNLDMVVLVDRTLETFVDTFTNTVNASWRLTNMSPNAPDITQGSSGFQDTETSNVIFKGTSGFKTASVTGNEFGAEISRTNGELLVTARYAMDRGKVYTYYLVGFVDGTPELELMRIGHTDAL